MNKKFQSRLRNLDKKLVDLFEDLKDYTDSTLDLSPKEGAWSVLEIMQHLMLAERTSLNYIQHRIKEEPVFDKAGVGASLRSFVLKSAMSIPLKYKAPFATGKDAFMSNPTFWEVAKEWRTDRTTLKDFLTNLPAEFYDKAIYKHPRVGHVSLNGMITFHDKHFDRHLKQIKRTLDAIDACKQV